MESVEERITISVHEVHERLDAMARHPFTHKVAEVVKAEFGMLAPWDTWRRNRTNRSFKPLCKAFER